MLSKIVSGAIPKARVYFCFETLEYQRRGGRIGRAELLLGARIKIHPIVELENGELKPLGRERSRSKALDRLHALAKEFGEYTVWLWSRRELLQMRRIGYIRSWRSFSRGKISMFL